MGVFDCFVGKTVKVPYTEGEQFRVARGILDQVNARFITLRSDSGPLVINKQSIEKLTQL